jgi:RimJ/RimL family protein N-acetyltransferase
MVTAPSEILIPDGRLRRALKEDLPAFAEMNADGRVMEFFPHPWSYEESRAAFEKIESGFAERGFGIYVLEVVGEFSGVVGLSMPSFKAYFTPAVEVLWRLLPRYWGRGLATVAARAVLDMAFQTLDLTEVVAFTVIQNQRSIQVMERLGMKRDSEPFFDHPGVMDDRLRRHVLYRARPSSGTTVL